MKRFLKEFEQGGLPNPNHSLDNSYRFKKRRAFYHHRKSPTFRSRPSPRVSCSGLPSREDMAGSAWNTQKNVVTPDKQSLHEHQNSFDHVVQQLRNDLEVTRDQLYETQKDYMSIEDEARKLLVELSQWRGDEAALQLFTIQDCETMRMDLLRSLESVEARKNQLIQNELVQSQEARLCAVCWENEKSVVLLPCRHFALCQPCSKLNDEEGRKNKGKCPICRQDTLEKLVIFG